MVLALGASCGAGGAQEGHPIHPAESPGPRARLGTAQSARARLAPPALATSLRSNLVGRWEGSDFTLTVDQDAMQANRDPERPFQWDPLHILDARENMLVFELGGDRYIALITGESMTLTQAGLAGYRSLTRKR
ncbi:hypothetical protein FHR71_004864 [Methylobacterium sp. RAS18]|nr:hypothetical protein [Methylobacterium sp. RAS18]